MGGLTLALGLLTNHAAAQTTYNWVSTTGTDWNTAADWTQGSGFPGSGTSTADTASFAGPEGTNPNLSTSESIASLQFSTTSTTGYTLSSTSSSVTLTLNSTQTAAGTPLAVVALNTSLANTISAPLIFANATTTNTEVISQAGIGGTLILSGTLQTAGCALQLNNSSNGVIVVQNSNSTLTANVKLNGGSVVLGDNGTLGSGVLTFNNTTNIALTPDQTSRTITNPLGTFGGTSPAYVFGQDPNSTAEKSSLYIGNGNLLFSNTAAVSLGASGVSARRFVVYNNTTIAAAINGGGGSAQGIIKTGTGTLTLSGNNTFQGTVSVQAGVGFTGPNGGSIMSSTATAGTLVLSGSNTFTGATTISAGTLSAAADSALGNTASISVTNNGMLQLANATANNDRVNNAAPITLTSGTIQKGTGVSEGTSSSVGLGALTLASGSTGNAIDFTSTAGTLTFASIAPNGATLTINNYLNNGTDHLIFNQDVSAAGYLNEIAFAGYSGDAETALGGGFYEITPVPEPANWVWGLASLGLLSFHLHRRTRVVTPPVAAVGTCNQSGARARAAGDGLRPAAGRHHATNDE